MREIVVKRPWGMFRRYVCNERCTVKILTVKPNQILSLQSHQKRDELWVVLDDGVEAQVGKRKLRLKEGQKIFIPRKTKHRLRSFGKEARILEISLGFFDEKDEKRFEDIYKRV
jgi:mannose-6-phosphate isomerase-like protein (cupin superfamily)